MKVWKWWQNLHLRWFSNGSQGIVAPVGVEIEMRNEMCSWELLRGLRRNRFFTSEESKMQSTVLWESEGFTFTLRRWRRSQVRVLKRWSVLHLLHVIEVFEPVKPRKRSMTVILQLGEQRLACLFSWLSALNL